MCITSKYLSQHNTNNIKGTLCAAAYRTLGTDEWSYKYYRYDARGRVIKMWNYIAGLGWKITKYEYNSQNQLTKLEYQSESDTDYKRYIYNYDYAGRMHSVSTEDSGPPPDYNYEYAIYKYNQNSQVDSVFMNNFNLTLSYAFNNRNWITNCANSSSIFGYSLDYAPNGNVTNQTISGIYRNNFSNTKDVRSNFTYDKSNRLKKVERYNTKYFDLTGDYSYDPDGNFTSLTRSYNSDNFSYDYYSGTNRLKKVTGSTDQYTYDYNGNQTNDYINNNTGIKYDHRNLITEFTRQDLNQDPPITDVTRYKYDEAGNRVRKTIYRSTSSNPTPLPEENEDLPPGWSITKDEYYSRDASGKEIAVYQSYNLDYWNVWGAGNEGRIKSTGMKYFYLKDHLGSIRAVINQNNVLVQAQDYDPWGHIARTWDSTSTDYKFTGKEHDNESSYDYFGARYYDSRVGRWGSVDPMFEKHIQFTPYNYVLGNPIMLIDPDGRQIDFNKFMNNGGFKSDVNNLIPSLEFVTGFKFIFKNNQLDISSESDKGSSTAKEYVRQAIANKTQVDYSEKYSETNIETGVISYSPDQIDNFESHGGNSEKQGHGMSFIEEIIHSVDKEGHTESKFGDIGTVVKKTNEIRKQLGIGERLSYLPFVVEDAGKIHKYIPYDRTSFDVMDRENNKVNHYGFNRNSFEHQLTNYIKY